MQKQQSLLTVFVLTLGLLMSACSGGESKKKQATGDEDVYAYLMVAAIYNH